MTRRSRVGCRLLAGMLLGSMIATLAMPLAAAEKDDNAQRLREALHREIYGLQAEKQAMLREIIAEHPDSPAAHWHLGHVRQNDKWVKPATEAIQLKNDTRLAGYYHRRGETEDSVAGQMKLATWCEKRGLHERAKAHLSRVIQLEPNHTEAREQLGFVRQGVNWVHRNEIAASLQKQKQQAVDLNKRASASLKLLKRLGSRSEQQRTKALDDISQLDQVDWIASLELRIAPHSQLAAAAAITALGNMTDPDAMEALTRIAIFAPWPETRVAAAQKLKNWPEEYYVPQLLREMYSPVQTNVATTTDGRGRLIYRHMFLREGQEEQQLAVLDTAYGRDARPGGNPAVSIWLASFMINAQVENLERAAMQQNMFTTELNMRIADCLKVTTGQNMPANPSWWWNWWNEHNEVFVSSEKQVKVAYNTDQVVVTDLIPSGGRGDCLRAGTLVWSENGMRAIETIEVGDLVLSQNVDTGELTYKPVLQTTVRPAGPLVQMQIGTQTLETSGGHLLWVTGEGWVKSRDMISGSPVHSLEGSLIVSTVTRQSSEETYNLVVEGFHTYFITERKLLSHDNTVRVPTAAVVPGLCP